jgi:hypothetical protein
LWNPLGLMIAGIPRIFLLRACAAGARAGASPEMSRRLASVSLLAAWLCASGAMLDVAQLVAWTRMFAGYARTESVAAAVRETFDPGRPCALCRAVGKARDACDRGRPAVPASGVEKVVLILDRASPFVSSPVSREWPVAESACAVARAADVPVPPPRSGLS